jgi:hypothetical protein
MRQSDLLCAVLTLASLCGSATWAKEPNAVFGYGTTRCIVFVNESKNKDAKFVADLTFGWVQGWFSARNAAGDMRMPVKTVGGSLSPATLMGFLVSECEEHPDFEVYMAAETLYDRFAVQGL